MRLLIDVETSSLGILS